MTPSDDLLDGSIEEIRERLRSIDKTSDAQLLDRVDAIIRDIDRAEVVRSEAAMTLGRCDSETTRASLHAMLAGDDPMLRQLAAGGLGESRSEETLRQLISSLTDTVNKVRNAAERSLLKRIEEVKAVGVDDLIELLAHHEPLTRSPAARLLGQTQDERALQPLLQHLRSEDWLDRMWAVKALGDLNDKQAVSPLTDVLFKDSKNRVRAFATDALKSLRPDDVEALLKQCSEQDEDEGVRKAAHEALLALGFESTDTEIDPFAD